MTLLLTTIIMMAFATVYTALLAMLGPRSGDLVAALMGRPLRGPQAGSVPAAASRRLSRA